jgi:hypothetical protein
MKKLLCFLILAFMIPGVVLAASSVVEQKGGWRQLRQSNIWQLEVLWTANTTGAVTTEAMPAAPGAGLFMGAVTDPGSTAPTDNYDIQLQDPTYSYDMMQGKLLNRDTSTTETVGPKGYPYDGGTINFVLSGNTANGAVGTLLIWILVLEND